MARGMGPRQRSRGCAGCGLPQTVTGYLQRWTLRRQAVIVLLSLLLLPTLYIVLELPRVIVDDVLLADKVPSDVFGAEMSVTEYLLGLCGAFALAFLAQGGLKFLTNIYACRMAEAERRRLRLILFRNWRQPVPGAVSGGAFAPVVAQEVEPIGGFVGEALRTPLIQGGTALVAVTFLFVQNPLLGGVAVALLPLQLVAIPRLQRQVNALARNRNAEIRTLSGTLAVPDSPDQSDGLIACFRRIEAVRRKYYERKFLMKLWFNTSANTVPLAFYGFGGYLVLNGSLTLGALVASIAAQRELAPPVRELFRFYQTYQDVKVRYHDALSLLPLTSSSELSGRQNLRPDGDLA